MSFLLVQKSVTLNDLERRNGRYFALFQRIRVPSGRKSSRSLSHLLMNSCHNRRRSVMPKYSHRRRQCDGAVEFGRVGN